MQSLSTFPLNQAGLDSFLLATRKQLRIYLMPYYVLTHLMLYRSLTVRWLLKCPLTEKDPEIQVYIFPTVTHKEEVELGF